MKNNYYKKLVYQDNFIKNYSCSAKNHPEGWSWWKNIIENRLERNLKMKENLIYNQVFFYIFHI